MTLKAYKNEVKKELHAILAWWIKYTVDKKNGGFYGKINNNNHFDPKAIKGLVLNARVLYTFSAAFLLTPKKKYLSLANRAFKYLKANFLDTEHGGFYWSVNDKGKMKDGKKQVYGQAFAIYALAEYYKASRNNEALKMAKNCFKLVEKHSFDAINTGYLEAFTEKWNPISDLRLSEKDQNEKKSMNTHLHVIEAYANLYLIYKSEKLKNAIEKLLNNFKQHIVNQQTHHLNLFFTEKWEIKSPAISFGHDIEAAWLLLAAAQTIKNKEQIENFKAIALKIANATTKGLNEHGALWYEFDPLTQNWTKEMHWWPQAEAMVGFFNAWQINKEEKHLTNSLKSWSFIKAKLIDHQNGEWFWGINSDFSLMEEDKAGFWKCPYHNSRACMEIIKRIEGLKSDSGVAFS